MKGTVKANHLLCNELKNQLSRIRIKVQKKKKKDKWEKKYIYIPAVKMAAVLTPLSSFCRS